MADVRQERAPRLGRQDWIEATLAALAEGGLDAVRVEALAKRLRVTKGGFYWHFRDRADLHAAVLDEWARGRMEVIERQTFRDGRPARGVLHELLDLYAAKRSEKGRAIELAIRDWARRDSGAAAAVARVDDYRLERVGALFRDLGLDAEQAFARAYLFYAYVFGQSLLVPVAGGGCYDEAHLACARILIDEASGLGQR